MSNAELQYRLRLAEFRGGPLQQVLDTNRLCHEIAHRYASGDIITKEEALSQMIVQLAKDWSAMQKEAYARYMGMPTRLV